MASFNRAISSSGTQRPIMLTVPFVVFLIVFHSNILNGSCYRVVRQVPGADAAAELDPMMNETSATATGKNFYDILREVFVTNETFIGNTAQPTVLQADITPQVLVLMNEVFMTNTSSNATDPTNSTMNGNAPTMSAITSSTMATSMAAPIPTTPTVEASMSTSNESILVSTMQPVLNTVTSTPAKGTASNLALNVGFLLLSFALVSV